MLLHSHLFHNKHQLDLGIKSVPFQIDDLSTKNLSSYNDIAYYLQQANANDEAIFLLEKIIEKFPNRTVAYLNLADAYN